MNKSHSLPSPRINVSICFQAVMEEAELRLAEIRKSHYEFDRDIVKGAVNAQTNKVVSEKVVRYFEDKLRARVRYSTIFYNL